MSTIVYPRSLGWPVLRQSLVAATGITSTNNNVFYLSTPFRHSPLKHTSDIRIVHLLPGTGEGPICCIIETAGGDNPAGYSALSYTWGDTSATAAITLNGQPFTVTENLLSALRHLRNPDNAISLWIDAICINQNDLSERSWQVRRMKSIYENAARVICWLGSDADESDLAMAKLLEITRAIKMQLSAGKGIMDAIQIVIDTRMRSILAPSQAEAQSLWDALSHLFARPWWYRIWIVQEATTSVETIIMCGGTWITRDAAFFSITAILKYLDLPENSELLLASPFTNAIRLNMFRDDRADGGSKMKLLNLLQELRRYEATDPRDKVYAVAALANDGGADSQQLRPDYTKSLAQVYTGVVTHAFSQKRGWGQQFDVLGLCCGQGGEDLPSWVPDLRVYPNASPLVKHLRHAVDDMETSPRAYSASGPGVDSVIPLMPDRFLVSAVDDILRVKAATVDVIADVAPASTDRVHYAVERSWAPTNGTARYFTGETLEQAFLRTIVADVQWETGEPVKRGYGMVWPDEDTSLFENINQNMVSLKAACLGRRLAVTRTGLIGLVPEEALIGDEIHVIIGGQVLYVLRPPPWHAPDTSGENPSPLEDEEGGVFDDTLSPSKESASAEHSTIHAPNYTREHIRSLVAQSENPRKDAYSFVGECYVHGLMDGEVIEHMKTRGVEVRSIDIR